MPAPRPDNFLILLGCSSLLLVFIEGFFFSRMTVIANTAGDFWQWYFI